MKKFNTVMWAIYWVIFAITMTATVLYMTVDKVRTWINSHVMVPYVKACEDLAGEIEDMYYSED